MPQKKPLISESRFDSLFPVLLALALMALLFPIPRPRMVSNQPWRAEFLTSIALTIGVIGYYLSNKKASLSLLPDSTLAKRIVYFFSVFAIWGLLSCLWSSSLFSAWHHTMVWCEFILFFLLTIKTLEHRSGLSLVFKTFLWLTAMIATLCFLDYATLPDFKSLEGTLRARYSSYAELLITVLPLLFAAVIYIRKASSRFMLVVIASAGWIVVMLSLSKGAFIAGIIGFLCFFALSLANGKPQFRRKILFLAGVWLTLTVAVQAGFSLLAPVPATVDYISGKTDATRETSTARVFFWRVGAEMARNDLLIGVGADNFGRTFNKAREAFRMRSPDDPQDEIVGNNLVERAHNELLQIIAELGIVGLILFVTPFVLMASAIFKLVRQRKHASPLLWASAGGMTAFIVSSMVSSFSLRIVQNGIAFFIVTAVAVWIMTRKPSRTAANVSSLTFLAACLLILAMLVTFSLKGLAEFQVYRGMNNIDDSAAIEQFKTAAMLDPDYVSTSLLTADRLYKNKNYDEAATELRKAIVGGLGVIVIYSSLAELEEKTGDIESADKTYNDGLKIFPRSVFLRVRYAKFLSDSGETVMADKQITLAKSFDERQTSGWFNLLNKGSIAAFYEAQANPQIALPAELKPESIVLRYLDKPPAEDEDK